MNKQNQVKKKKCQIVILRRTPRKEKVGIQVLYILFQHSITCSANMEIKIKKYPSSSWLPFHSHDIIWQQIKSLLWINYGERGGEEKWRKEAALKITKASHGKSVLSSVN